MAIYYEEMRKWGCLTKLSEAALNLRGKIEEKFNNRSKTCGKPNSKAEVLLPLVSKCSV